MKNCTFILIACLLCIPACYSQTASSQFNWETLQYNGTKKQQLELLLQKPMPKGWVKHGKPAIDSKFLNLVTRKQAFTKAQVRAWLQQMSISDSAIGGSIDGKLASLVHPKSEKTVTATYFIIHDVSYEEPAKYQFPANIDSAGHEANQFGFWTKVQKNKGYFFANVFVTRPGDSKTYIDFKTPSLSTKFERTDYNKHFSLRGLFLGIELVQQRVKSKPGSYFDKAPQTGFTSAQYERLALIYIVASIRKGDWLIPAYHIVIDEGIGDGHDDPQNFNLKQFTDAVLNISKSIMETPAN